MTSTTDHHKAGEDHRRGDETRRRPSAHASTAQHRPAVAAIAHQGTDPDVPAQQVSQAAAAHGTNRQSTGSLGRGRS
ncbi:MAG TPA: hypothetical protein IAA98_14580 [Candidatus Avipropionibacterium avicola]|uniref:Uncharacterized protein n=1 Tax=Candidatus Avipropionibacterium avicola TaxID=2840701 RepID=A0A9D1KPF6_9ACTN|nr:hypothetical protein [Candidatus Avipropionibacterium avicola]